MLDNIKVTGRIEVDRSPSLKQEHDAEQKQSASREEKKYLVEKLTLVAVLIYAGLTLWQAYLTRQIVSVAQRTCEASQRPYIGAIMGLTYKLENKETKEISAANTPNRDAVSLDFNTAIKNYGTVPGTNFSAAWRIFVNGTEMPSKGIPATPSTLYPTQVIYLGGNSGTEDFPGFMDGTKTLETEITIAYDGPSGHYGDCQKYRFAPAMNAFMALGKCTH